MKRHLAHGLLAAMLVLAAAAGPAAAQQPMPDEFTRSGKLDNLGKDYIVINDQRYLLSKNLRIHTPKRSFAPVGELKAGQFVGVMVSGEGGGKLGTVDELWVLPNLRPAANP